MDACPFFSNQFLFQSLLQIRYEVIYVFQARGYPN